MSKDEKQIPTSNGKEAATKPEISISTMNGDKISIHQLFDDAGTGKILSITMNNVQNEADQLEKLFGLIPCGDRMSSLLNGSTIARLGVESSKIVITHTCTHEGDVVQLNDPFPITGSGSRHKEMTIYGYVLAEHLFKWALPNVLQYRSLDTRGLKDEKLTPKEIASYVSALSQLKLCMMSLGVYVVKILVVDSHDFGQTTWSYYAPPLDCVSHLNDASMKKNIVEIWNKFLSGMFKSRSESWSFFQIAFLCHLRERAGLTEKPEAYNKAVDMATKDELAEFKDFAYFLAERWDDKSVHERLCSFLSSSKSDALCIFYNKERDREHTALGLESERQASAEKKKKKQKPSSSSSSAAAAATTSAAASAPSSKPKKSNVVEISSGTDDDDKPVSSLSKKKRTENNATSKPSESTAVGKKDEAKASKKRNRSPEPNSSDDEVPVSKKLKAAYKKDKEEHKKKKAERASSSKKKPPVVVVSSGEEEEEEVDPLELSADDESDKCHTDPEDSYDEDSDPEFKPEKTKSDSEHSDGPSSDEAPTDEDESSSSSESEDDNKKKKKK